MRLWDEADFMCYILSLFKLKNKSPSKEDSPLPEVISPSTWFGLFDELITFWSRFLLDANPQEQKISSFLWSYERGGDVCMVTGSLNFSASQSRHLVLGDPCPWTSHMGDGVHQGAEAPPHPPTQGWMSHPADSVLSCCSLGVFFPPWAHHHGMHSAFALLWWEQQTLWKQTEGMTLTSLVSPLKTEPITPICQVYFKRYVDFCEMVRVKATVLGLGPGWCSATLNLPCLLVLCGKEAWGNG